MSFNKVLKRFGFKRIKQQQPGIIPYKIGKMYAEVYKDEKLRDMRCWAVGGSLRCIKSFPGGWNYFSPEELENELKEKDELTRTV